jgi:putative transposase
VTSFKPRQIVERIEVLTEPERRRRRSVQEKVAIVQETLEPRQQKFRRLPNDTELVTAIREQVAGLPTYGYRRVWALLRRSHEMTGAPRVSAKRVYRVMRGHQLLLRRLGQRRDTRRHDGRIAADRGNVRWCSDGFEFRCDDGSPLRVTFALDCRHQLGSDYWRP